MRVALRAGATLALLGSLALVAPSTNAQQASPPAPLETGLGKGVVLTLGAQVTTGPAYDGAKTSVFGALPYVDIRPIGEERPFSAPDDGIDYAVLDFAWLKAGPVGRFRDGRSGASFHELAGLRTIDWTLEAGGFLELWPTDWLRVRGEVRRGLNGHHGLVADLAADVVEHWGPFYVSLGPRAELGDTKFVSTYFSVRPYEAALNGVVPAFSAQGGATSVGALASIRYDFADAWSSTLFGQYTHLVGDAARSPISRVVGQRDTFTVGIILSRAFTIERFW